MPKDRSLPDPNVKLCWDVLTILLHENGAILTPANSNVSDRQYPEVEMS